MRKSLQLSLTAIFAALHAVLYFISFGLWRNWGIYLESIEGIILGPKIGFFAALIGSIIGRIANPTDPFWMFGIVAEPLSVLIAGFLSRAQWKPALVAYVIMLSAYFIHPFGRALPLWTILDILLALVLIYPAARFSRSLFAIDVKRLPIALVLISFVTIAADSLVRVFLLVPAGLYSLFPDFFGNYDMLYVVFVGAAVSSYIEDLIVVIISFIVGVPLILSLSKLGFWKERKQENKK